MTKIFKQLARHWAVCLVVFALLFVQAYCDLALPDYTSKIVDTGIQQGGIESPLPQTVRQSTLDALSLLMSEEDAQKLQNAYQYYLQDDGVLQLRSDLTEDERTALEDAVTTPDIVLYMAAELGAAVAAAGSLLHGGGLGTPEVVLALLVGNVLSTPMRGLRHQLPTALAIKLIVINQGLRALSMIAMTAVYWALAF